MSDDPGRVPRPPLPPRRRVVVAGSSMPMGLGPADHGEPGIGPPYPVRVERALRAAGHDVEVIVRSRARQLQDAALRHFEEDLLIHAPDVVILHFGTVDVFSGVLPIWLRNALYADFPPQGAASIAWRRYVVRRVRHLARRVQIAHGRLVRRAGRRSPDRVRREVELVLDSLRRLVGGPPVVLLGPTEASEVWERAMPGINERAAAIDAVYRDVASARDDVTFVDLAAVLGGVDWRSIDGLHFKAEGHEAIAAVLAPLVEELLSPDRSAR